MSSHQPAPARARWLRLAGLLLAGLAVLWLAAAFVVFSGEAGDGDVHLPRDEYAWAFDYEAYLGAASRLAEEGTPYAPELTGGAFESGPGGLYYYSPVLAVALLPVEGIAATDSSTWWYLLHVLALVAACALMPVSSLVRLFTFVTAAFSFAVMRDLALGNVSTLLLPLMVLSWRWLDRPLGSVSVALAMSLRPNLGLLLIWQLLRRQWRVAAWTIAAGLVLVLLTLPFTGLDGYLDYLEVLRNLNTPSNDAAPANGWVNHDLGELTHALGLSSEAVGLVRIGSIVLGVGAMLLSLRRDREIGFMVTLMASFLVVPMLWDHYLVMLAIPAAFLAYRWHPVAVLLPLLSWLPDLAALTVAAAMLLPFLVHDPEPDPEPGGEQAPAGAAPGATA